MTQTGSPEADEAPRARTSARSEFHPLRVGEVERLTDDSVAVTFDVPERLREVFAFQAGQSLTLRRRIDGQEHRRTYSICAPAGSAPRVGVREIPGGGLFSSWLTREVRVGDTVEVNAPSGSFRADPSRPGRHLCIAAGSGITPMLSVASSVLAHPESSVTLIYGNRTTGSVMFAEEIADLKNRFGPRFHVIHVLSREPRDVDLLSGRLDAERIRRIAETFVPVAGLDHVWLCGPFGLIADARSVMAELGVPDERVHFELFYVDEPPPEVHRADDVTVGEGSTVTVVLDGRTTTGLIPANRSILDGAATRRSDLPFACKGGVCGTCRAQVRGGEVDLRRNYALSADEVAAGFVLTCQSFPVSDDVVIDFDA